MEPMTDSTGELRFNPNPYNPVEEPLLLLVVGFSFSSKKSMSMFSSLRNSGEEMGFSMRRRNGEWWLEEGGRRKEVVAVAVAVAVVVVTEIIRLHYMDFNNLLDCLTS
ncbi:hypothetical protein OSB04_004752 [Centaurea solstitialis]|uniref:Transmembrane protein n=1 Tax=Centaurea solstitialis TaxID=347529 RepID=A0AA38WG60_9ASTR|nr:hypothetical protein OSB04_004752 [Centaurea solstitialis]